MTTLRDVIKMGPALGMSNVHTNLSADRCRAYRAVLPCHLCIIDSIHLKADLSANSLQVLGDKGLPAKLVEFDEDMFFSILLPPIIFYAGKSSWLGMWVSLRIGVR